MKIALVKKRRYSIVEITEAVTPTQALSLIPVLTKLFATSKDPVVLNLSVAVPTNEAIEALVECQMAAFKLLADLLIVSIDPRLVQLSAFYMLKEAEQLLMSGTSLNAVREKILKNMLDRLQTKIKELAPEQAALEEKYIEKENLPVENQRLESLLAVMTKQGEELEKYLKKNKVGLRTGRLIEAERLIFKTIKEGRFLISLAILEPRSANPGKTSS